jgi:hypothetical protein
MEEASYWVHFPRERGTNHSVEAGTVVNVA